MRKKHAFFNVGDIPAPPTKPPADRPKGIDSRRGKNAEAFLIELFAGTKNRKANAGTKNHRAKNRREKEPQGQKTARIKNREWRKKKTPGSCRPYRS